MSGAQSFRCVACVATTQTPLADGWRVGVGDAAGTATCASCLAAAPAEGFEFGDATEPQPQAGAHGYVHAPGDCPGGQVSPRRRVAQRS